MLATSISHVGLISNLSQSLMHFYNNHKGFRCEYFRGSGITDLKSIVTFEIEELGNNDIYDTMIKFYKNSQKPFKKHKTDKINYICEYIANMLHSDIKDVKAVWLCSSIDECVLYDPDLDDLCKEINIDCYNFYDIEYMPISDLGTQGFLIAYVEKPKVIEISVAKELYTMNINSLCTTCENYKICKFAELATDIEKSISELRSAKAIDDDSVFTIKLNCRHRNSTTVRNLIDSKITTSINML